MIAEEVGCPILYDRGGEVVGFVPMLTFKMVAVECKLRVLCPGKALVNRGYVHAPDELGNWGPGVNMNAFPGAAEEAGTGPRTGWNKIGVKWLD